MDLNAADHDTLLEALKSLGLQYTEHKDFITIRTKDGTITVRDGIAEFTNEKCQQWVNKIKQAYSLKTVEKIAKRYKFTITAKPGNKFTLRRY